MNIRPFEERDLAPTVELTNWFIRNTAVHFSTVEDTIDGVRAQWERGRARYPWLVAEVDGAFAGFARAAMWRNRAAYDWSCETAIYMAEGHRGKGLGVRLYTALLDDLRERGFHTAVGGATMPNDASVRLHEKAGFEHVGTYKRVGWKFGRWHDVAFWQAMLREGDHTPQQ